MEQVRKAIVAEAESWLRTPWHHMGDVKGAGVDCAQFLRMVFIATGHVEYFKPAYYPEDWMLHRSEEVLLGYVEQYSRRVVAPLLGDIVIYKVGRCFSHGALVIDWPSKIIHSFRPERSVVYGAGDQGFLASKEVRFYSVLKRG